MDMEESNFLTDLLECSVCFEQLDVQSKVLPCQHTFCKRCLDGIVSTQKELRCPECRVLVEINVDGLPPNILLIRLLEGLKNNSKQGARNSQRIPNQAAVARLQDIFPSQTPAHARKLCPVPPRFHSPVDNVQQRETPTRSPVAVQSNTPTLVKPFAVSSCQTRAKALYCYEGKEDGDLSFRQGDVITIRKQIDANWFHGELNGKQGFLPASYVQAVVPSPSSQSPQCKALYDFRVSDVEEMDCLSFNKGNIITVIRRVDENWAEGKLADRVGIFPISFVEMNSSAKIIMKLASLNSSGPSRTVPPTPVISSSMESTSSSSHTTIHKAVLAVTPSHTGPQETESSASSPSSSISPSSAPCTPSSVSSSSSSLAVIAPFNSSPMTSVTTASESSSAAVLMSSSVANPLPSMTTISSPPGPLPPSSMTTSQKRHSVCAPSSGSLAFPLIYHQRSNSHQTQSPHRHSMEVLDDAIANHWPSELARNGPSRSSCRHETSLMGARTPQSRSPPVPTYYVACFNYKPIKGDELELRKSELYSVSEKCQDGWFKGTSVRTGLSGVFPGNYVQLAKSSVPKAHYRSPSSHTPRAVSVMEGDHPPPLRPKPALNLPLTKSESTNLSNSTIYAKTRPMTLSTSGQHGIAANLMDWARAIAPPSRPPRSQGVTSPTHADIPTENIAPSSSAASTPSPQWAPVRVAATRNAPPACVSPMMAARSTSPLSGANVEGLRKAESEKKDTKEKKVSLMKRWTNKRKSKSPPPNSSFYCDNPTFVDTSPQQQPANIVLSNPSTSGTSIHVRSGSCPSEALGGGGRSAREGILTRQPAPPPLVRERFRCVVPYPSSSDYELELQVGDIVFVHKKREDGWFKGTLQRTGKTGLFPSSFVTSF